MLSNRLVKQGGRRIREDVLERDYCLAWFLAALGESDLRTNLALKGGTALKRCYFGDYRFSEDLDFTLLEAIPFDDILHRLERVYEAVRESSGIVIAFDREDRREHSNSYTFYLAYTGPLPVGVDGRRISLPGVVRTGLRPVVCGPVAVLNKTVDSSAGLREISTGRSVPMPTEPAQKIRPLQPITR